jgi:hypothetical protein
MVAGLTWWVWPKPKLRSCATRETRLEQLASCSPPNQPISQQIFFSNDKSAPNDKTSTSRHNDLILWWLSAIERDQRSSRQNTGFTPIAGTSTKFDQTDVFTCTSDQSDGNEHPMNAQSCFSCVLWTIWFYDTNTIVTLTAMVTLLRHQNFDQHRVRTSMQAVIHCREELLQFSFFLSFFSFARINYTAILVIPMTFASPRWIKCVLHVVLSLTWSLQVSHHPKACN